MPANGHGSFIKYAPDVAKCNVFFGIPEIGDKICVISSRALVNGEQLFHNYKAGAWAAVHQ